MIRQIQARDWLFTGLCFFLVLLSLIAFVWNHFRQQYYLDFQWFGMPIALYFLLMMVGTYFFALIWKNDSLALSVLKAVAMLYISLSVMEFCNTAILLTPFQTHDYFIHHMDRLFGFHLLPLMQVVRQYPLIQHAIWFGYYSIFTFIHSFPIFLAIVGEITILYEYYLSFLTSVFLGYTLFYFFPTMTSPASIYPSYFFTDFQLNTLRQFQLEHLHKVIHFDLVGGVVSFPSFHAIWACFAIYFLSIYPKMRVVAVVYGVIIFITAVATGWHYFFDIVGGAMVAMLSIQLAKFMLAQTETR